MRVHRARIGRVLMAVTVPTMLLVALLGWGVASPVGASPDDDYHMASIWCAGGTDALCGDGLGKGEMKVPKTLITNSSCFAFHPENSGTCHEEPSNELVNTARGNFLADYPPVFYSVMSVFSGADIGLSILLMRSFNAALFVAVVTLLFFCLPYKHRSPLAWGTAMTLVPLGMFLIPSVNPSSWAVLSAATLWISLVGYFNATQRKKQVAFAAIAAFATIAGAGARADSAAYAGLAMLVAVILTFERTRSYAVRAILPAALAVISIAFFLSAGQGGVVGTSVSSDDRTDTIELALANLVLLPQLWAGALGTTGLGWLDTAMPGIVWVSTLAVFFALFFTGIRHMGGKKATALSLVFASLIVIPLFILVKDQVTVGAGVQPRYIYPLLIMLAGVALWSVKGGALRLSKAQALSLAILLAVANSVALHANLRRYVTGIDAAGADLDAGIEWWWETSVSPMTVWLVSSFAFGVVMVALALYSLPGSRRARISLVESRAEGTAELVTTAN